MTTRTFKQTGQAYGSTPATITATINGTVVFSGPISTLNTPVPDRPSTVSSSDIFTWTNTVDYAGTQSYSISVTGSQLLLTDTLADYCIANESSVFSSFYNANIGSVIVSDPLTNVDINGASIQRDPELTNLSGQWYWLIPAGSTFTATLNVSAGALPPPATPPIPPT